MAKKRKLESQPSQLALKIEEEEQIIEEEVEEEDPEQIIEEEEVEEEDPEEFEEEEDPEEFEEEEDPEEFEEEEVEEIEEEEEEEEEEKEEEGDQEEEHANGAAQGPGNDDEDEYPVRSLIPSFSKEALITLLTDAAERHPDVAARVRDSADADPSQRKIFVHGLKWDITSEMLLEAFSKYGKIDDCRLVTDKSSGRSKGYGFILFKSGRGARRALKEPQKTINNRLTTCQLASLGPIPAPPPPPPQGKPKAQVHQQSEYTQRKIYVSNVGAELDPKKLTAFFSKYGEIEEGPLGLDKKTGKPKGFCLFVYKTAESAKWALAEPHKQFEGVTLHCQKAIDGPKPHKMQIIRTLKSQKRSRKSVGDNNNQQFGSTVVPVPGQAPPPPLSQPQPQPQILNVDPTALGQALTTLIMAQGSGLNLFGLGGQAGQDGNGNRNVGGMNGMGMGSYGNQGGYPNQQRGQGGGYGPYIG